MRVRFLVDLIPVGGKRPYTATLLSVSYRGAASRAQAVEDARFEFARLFGRDAFEIPGVYIG